MPVGEQAAGRSLGTIFYPARPTARFARGQLWYLFPRFLPGRGLSSQHCCLLLWRSRNCFGTNLVAPGEIFFPGSKAGEITAAGRAAVRCGAKAQQEARPCGRIIVVHRPFGQFLPVATGTARVPPGPVRPGAGFPAAVAATAAQTRNAHQVLQVFAQPLRMGDAYVPCPAVWASQLHEWFLHDHIGPFSRSYIGFHVRREGPL
jgi:hypothetical protein